MIINLESSWQENAERLKKVHAAKAVVPTEAYTMEVTVAKALEEEPTVEKAKEPVKKSK